MTATVISIEVARKLLAAAEVADAQAAYQARVSPSREAEEAVRVTWGRVKDRTALVASLAA